MLKKLISIVLALVMVLSVMTVGVVSVGAKPDVPVILDDLPEWEWIIETPTGDYVDMLDEPAQEDMTELGYTSNKTISEDIDTVKIKLYHYDWDNPNWNPRENDPLVLEKEVILSGLSSDSVAYYSYGYRDDNAVWKVEFHSLEFNKTSRRFIIPYSTPSRSGGNSVLFINKKFMDDLYRDRIIAECGEPKSFADWANNRVNTSNDSFDLPILASKDGENWMKLVSLKHTKAEIVGENQDIYLLYAGLSVFWDYTIPILGSQYWMLAEGIASSENKYVTPNNPLATGTITWYNYGGEVNRNSTFSDYYEAYVNAPAEYKRGTINERERSAFMLNTPESETSGVNYITQSGSSEQSIVTLDYNTANLKVTVPTVLPVNVDSNNNVTVADNAQISNLSNGSVDVTNAEIQTDEWSVVGFDTDFTKVPVDTKQYGFKLNGDDVSDGVNTSVFNTINGNNHIGLSYDANVAIQSQPITNEDIGRIVFTVAWHK